MTDPHPEAQTPSPAAPKSKPFPWLVFVAVAVLAGAGWMIVSQMSDDARVQDCAQSGRKNCVPLDPRTGR